MKINMYINKIGIGVDVGLVVGSFKCPVSICPARSLVLVVVSGEIRERC